MKLQLNGSSAEFEGPLTLSALLERLKLSPESVVVEHNLQVPSKSDYGRLTLRDGDRVEIVKFMGGG